MEPVEWTDDGWPQAPLGARRGAPMPAPKGVAQRPMIELSDDFKAPALKATWGAWKETDMSRYQVGDGMLRVRAKGGSYAESSPLTIRARDESYQVEVAATIQGESCAALGLEYNPQVAVYVELKHGQLNVHGPKEKLANQEWPAGDCGCARDYCEPHRRAHSRLLPLHTARRSDHAQRVHEVITALEDRFKLECPEVYRVTIHPEPVTDNLR